jgi:hypothetical protein
MIGGNRKSYELYTPYDRPFGLTYGQWTTKWWLWALSIPKKTSPVLDSAGEYAGIKQRDPVWFLAGTFGENRFPRRSCKIPRNRAILFPVINYEANYFELPNLDRVNLVNHVVRDQDDIKVKEAIVDGEKMPIYRVKSEPEIFQLSLPVENSLDLPVGTTYATTDGYWVFLKQLTRGQHQIYFHGSCSNGTRSSTALYDITVE